MVWSRSSMTNSRGMAWLLREGTREGGKSVLQREDRVQRSRPGLVQRKHCLVQRAGEAVARGRRAGRIGPHAGKEGLRGGWRAFCISQVEEPAAQRGEVPPAGVAQV